MLYRKYRQMRVCAGYVVTGAMYFVCVPWATATLESLQADYNDIGLYAISFFVTGLSLFSSPLLDRHLYPLMFRKHLPERCRPDVMYVLHGGQELDARENEHHWIDEVDQAQTALRCRETYRRPYLRAV